MTVIKASIESKTKEDLINSEKLYQQLFDGVPMGFALYEIIFDKKRKPIDYRFLKINPAFETQTGFTKKNTIGKTLKETYPNIEQNRFDKYESVVLNSTSINYIEYNNKTKRYYTVKAFSPSNNKLAMLFEDITEKKIAEENKERFELAMDATKDGLYDWNLVTNQIYYSPGWKSMLGYKDEELANDFTTWEKLTEKEDAEQSWIMQQELINKQRDHFEIEFKMKHKNGHWVDILSRAKAVFDDKGTAIRIVGTHIDITERKNYKVQLGESEKKYRDLINLAQEGIWVIDKNNISSFVNPSMAKMLKYSPEEMLGKSLFDFMDEAGIKLANENLERRKSGLNEQHDFEFICKDGNRIYCNITTAPILDNTGNYQGAIAGVMDITDRKNVEKELYESQKIFRNFMEYSPMYVFFKDENIRPIRLSKNYETMLNKPLEELLGKNMNELFPSDLAKRMVADDIKILEENKEVSVEEEFNGRYYTTIKFPIQIEGKPTYLAGYTIDITEKKLAEEMLKLSEEKFKALFDSSPDLVAITDLDGTFLDINRVFPGFNQEAIIGQNVVDFLNPYQKIEFKNAVAKTIETGIPSSYFPTVLKPDGTDTYWHNRVSLLKTGGETSQLVINFTNITEWKTIEKASKENEEKFISIFEQSPIAIEIYDKKGKLIDVNQQALNMFGVDDKKHVLGFDLWEDPNLSREKMTALKNGKPIFLSTSFDFEVIKKQKLYPTNRSGVMYMDMYAIPMIQKDEIIGYLLQIVDITERKQFLKKLQSRNEYIESVMENMPIGFALNSIDDGEVKYMNNNFEGIYGWSRDILTNTSIFFEKVFPDLEYREKMKTQIISDMQSGDAKRMIWKDLKIVTSTGEVRYILAYNIPLIEQNLMISTVQDTTQQKLTEDEITKHRTHLEELVKERTVELEETLSEVTRMNDLFVGREFRIKELKNEIDFLKGKQNK